MDPRKGDRIRLVRMTDDPYPIEAGTLGTIDWVGQRNIFGPGTRQVGVKWDNGRSLMLALPQDQYELIARKEQP